MQYPEAHAASVSLFDSTRSIQQFGHRIQACKGLRRRCLLLQVPARLLLLLAATHGSGKPPPSSQLAATTYRIQRLLEYHWGGHHPASLDVTVAQAW